jgi:hypothetical protein
MIIQSKIQNRGFQIRSVGAIGVWSVALLCGSLVAACSGTIETPTEEFPPRTSGGNQQAQTADSNNTPPRTQTQTANDDDDDDDDAAAADDDEETPAGDEEEPAAGDDEEPAAGDDEEPAAGALSFETDIHPIFSTTCGPCHAGGGFGGQDIGGPDLEAALQDAKDFQDRVLETIETGNMPPGCGSPPGGGGNCMSEEDFAAVEAWYEAGAPK